jgi:hypothetical protein
MPFAANFGHIALLVALFAAFLPIIALFTIFFKRA